MWRNQRDYFSLVAIFSHLENELSQHIIDQRVTKHHGWDGSFKAYNTPLLCGKNSQIVLELEFSQTELSSCAICVCLWTIVVILTSALLSLVGLFLEEVGIPITRTNQSLIHDNNTLQSVAERGDLFLNTITVVHFLLRLLQ